MRTVSNKSVIAAMFVARNSSFCEKMALIFIKKSATIGVKYLVLIRVTGVNK